MQEPTVQVYIPASQVRSILNPSKFHVRALCLSKLRQIQSLKRCFLLFAIPGAEEMEKKDEGTFYLGAKTVDRPTVGSSLISAGIRW